MINLVHLTFYITYVFLITTGSITFIEALATKSSHIRHILNIETVVSIIAGFFYSQFVASITKTGGFIDYNQINQTRYVDWSITTPFMLLSLCLVLGYPLHKPLTAPLFIAILLCNYAMLGFGYVGEIQTMDKRKAQFISFLFFILLFVIIYFNYIYGHNNLNNNIIFGLFVIIWSMYGFVYTAKEDTKNITYNVLDLIAKCFIGIFFWIYFTKIIVL